MRAFAPLPLDARRDFAFLVPDPEGMPNTDGRRYHGAVDWFSPAGTPVYAPHAGRVVEASQRREADGAPDISGQVFGGTVKVQDPEGIVWVFRHINPLVTVGQHVDEGDPIAKVSQWLDWPGGTHAHHEVWKTLAGGYAIPNAIDPKTIDYEARALDQSYYFEELPYDQGGNGPKLLGQAAGYADEKTARKMLAAVKKAGHIASLVLADDGRRYILGWKPGTYGKRFRFGPWADAENADALSRDYRTSTGRQVRRFNGRRRSLYPWPKEA